MTKGKKHKSWSFVDCEKNKLGVQVTDKKVWQSIAAEAEALRGPSFDGGSISEDSLGHIESNTPIQLSTVLRTPKAFPRAFSYSDISTLILGGNFFLLLDTQKAQDIPGIKWKGQ